MGEREKGVITVACFCLPLLAYLIWEQRWLIALPIAFGLVMLRMLARIADK